MAYSEGRPSCYATAFIRMEPKTKDFVGLDVSIKETANCMVNDTGQRIWEGSVPSTADKIAAIIREKAPELVRAGTGRRQLLDQNIIYSIEAAHDHASQWLWTYNNDRPNIPLMVCRPTVAGQRGIGGITPAQNLKMAASFYECVP